MRKYLALLCIFLGISVGLDSQSVSHLATNTMPSCGSTTLAAGAASTATVTLKRSDADYIIIFARVTGYAPSDVASFQFNGDTGTNYWWRFESWAAGGAVPADNVGSATTLIQTGIGTTLSRNIFLNCNNFATKEKLCSGDSTIGTGTTTAPAIITGLSGSWVNTTNRITSVKMVTAGGGNMFSGSGFEVFCVKF